MLVFKSKAFRKEEYPIHHMTTQTNTPATSDIETLYKNLRLAAQALADQTGWEVKVLNNDGVRVFETE